MKKSEIRLLAIELIEEIGEDEIKGQGLWEDKIVVLEDDDLKYLQIVTKEINKHKFDDLVDNGYSDTLIDAIDSIIDDSELENSCGCHRKVIKTVLGHSSTVRGKRG